MPSLPLKYKINFTDMILYNLPFFAKANVCYPVQGPKGSAGVIGFIPQPVSIIIRLG